MIKEQEILEA